MISVTFFFLRRSEASDIQLAVGISSSEPGNLAGGKNWDGAQTYGHAAGASEIG